MLTVAAAIAFACPALPPARVVGVPLAFDVEVVGTGPESWRYEGRLLVGDGAVSWLGKTLPVELRRDGTVGGYDLGSIADRKLGYATSLVLDALNVPLLPLADHVVANGPELRASEVVNSSYEKRCATLTRRYASEPRDMASSGNERMAEFAGAPPLDGRWTIEVNADGWPASVTGEETLKPIGAAAGRGVTTRFTLVRRSFPKDAKSPRLDSAPPAVRLSWHAEGAATDPMPLGYAQTLVGKLGIADVVKLGERLEGDSALTKLKNYFGAVLRLHPEASAELEQRAAGLPSNGLLYRGAIGALGEHGSPEAQAALVRLADARASARDDDGLMTTLLGLTEAPQATVASEAALWRFSERGAADDGGTVATLALGIVADNLSVTVPERGSELVRKLEQRFRGQKGATRALFARALGNSGSPELPRIFKPLLESKDAAMRQLAAEELRRVDTDAAASALLALAAKDPDPEVRRAAVAALAHQRRAAVARALPRALGLLTTETDAKVRVLLVRWFGGYASESPTVYDALERVRAAESDGAVKDAAAEALSGARRLLAL